MLSKTCWMMINTPLMAMVWKAFFINIEILILAEGTIERLLMTSAQTPKFKIGLIKSAKISVLRIPKEIGFLSMMPIRNKTINKIVKSKIVNKPTWIILDQPLRQPSRIEISRLCSSFCETEYTKPAVNIIDKTVDKNQISDEIDLIGGIDSDNGDDDAVI